MPLEAALGNVAKATIQFLPHGGQGVLVSGGFVLTASHCLLDPNDECKPLRCDHALLNEPIVIEIKTKSAERFKVMPLFVDAISDVAVLGAPDDPDLFEESRLFQQLCNSVVPAQISRRIMDPGETCKAWIHTHDQGWVEAEATADLNGFMMFTTKKQIASNTSGGPIVDEDGKILGVVSESSDCDETMASGRFASAHLYLPVWLSRLVFNGDASEETSST